MLLAQMYGTIAVLVGNIVFALIGILLARMTLIWFDHSKLGALFIVKVHRWDATSQAIYYGLRMLGVCLLVGLAIS